MFRVLIVDDSHEDRELLKLEIEKALDGVEEETHFYEARSIHSAHDVLKLHDVDLMTLDIEFDRLDEGVDALPEFFETYPTLNIIVVSGKLSKAEITERLFTFMRENVLKGKRWVRHFDVLDKKDEKSEALKNAHTFALKRGEATGRLKELFLLAEGHMEKDEVDKVREVYQKIQSLAPEEAESGDSLRMIERGGVTSEQALDYYRRGEPVVAALLLGHYLEKKLKTVTKRLTGRTHPGLYDCLKELERHPKFGSFKKELFQQALRLRNRAVHHPDTISDEDISEAAKTVKLLEARF